MSAPWTTQDAPIEALRRAGVITDEQAEEIHEHLNDLERENLTYFSRAAVRRHNSRSNRPWWWRALNP